MSARTIQEAARNIPVRAEYDVIVAGAGLGGIAAAIAAARSGAQVLLVERNGFLGGVATAGMCCSIFNCFFTSDGRLGPTGIPDELTTALADAMGYGEAWKKHKGHIIYDIELGKRVLQRQVDQAGVHTLLDTGVAATIVEGNRVRGIIIESKSGREALFAKVVIDATGDADVVAGAGEKYIRKAETPPIQSLCFRLGNVDTDAFIDYFRYSPDEYPSYMDVDWTTAEAIAQYDECGTFLFPHGGGMQMAAFQRAKTNGDLPARVGIHDTTDACQMHVMKQTGMVHVVTGFVHFDGLDIDMITRAITDGREMAFTVADVYRKYIPGFERSFVAGTAANLGVRFSRRIVPDYLLTVKHAHEAGISPLSVGRCIRYVNEIKHPGTGAWCAQIMSDRMFQIPLGCLLPEGLEGIVMGAGRSAGTDQYWLLRTMVGTMAVGQGAGAAAALAVAKGCSLRELDADSLRSALRGIGAETEI